MQNDRDNLAYRDYQALPDAVRALYSYETYLWLSDADKARLVQLETEPDGFDY